MKNFTERHHAFISAMYYKLLTETFGKRGENAFIMATQKYAEQRGSRMAQRAIRDGKELNFKTYCEYREWESTKEIDDEMESLGINVQSEDVSYSPHYEYNVYACPWHMQYKEMDLIEGACVYCKHLDKAIARGFNPYLDFRTTQTMHKNKYCNFILKNANIDKERMEKRKPENVKGFDYHCAHLYYTYKNITESIFGAEGKFISDKVFDEFVKSYGIKMADIIVEYKNTDFNII